MSSILVEGIKLPTTKDKLIIHFQKRKNHGGDVDSVVFPIDFNEPNSALVTFDDEETADSVMEVDQIFNGSKLSITKEYRVFSKCTATFDPVSLQILLKHKRSISEIIKDIKKHVPEVQITDSDQLGLIMSAPTWHQLQIVRELVQSWHKENNGEKGLSTKTTTKKNHNHTNGRMVDTTTSNGFVMNNGDMQPSTSSIVKLEQTTNKKAEKVDFTVDTDVMKFLLHSYAHEIETIKKTHKVELEFEASPKDSMNVACLSYKSSTHAANAQTDILRLFEDVQNLDEFQHEILYIENYEDNFNQTMSLIAACNSSREYFSEVFVNLKMDPREPTVSFLSINKDKTVSQSSSQVSLSQKWFKERFSGYKSLGAKPVNINIYGFVKQFKKLSLVTLESEATVRIVEAENGEDFAVFLVPQKEFTEQEFSIAKIKFSQIIAEANKNLNHWNCTVNTGALNEKEIEEKVEQFRASQKLVYFRRSVNSNRFTFTGPNTEQLRGTADKINAHFQK